MQTIFCNLQLQFVQICLQFAKHFCNFAKNLNQRLKNRLQNCKNSLQNLCNCNTFAIAICTNFFANCKQFLQIAILFANDNRPQSAAKLASKILKASFRAYFILF